MLTIQRTEMLLWFKAKVKRYFARTRPFHVWLHRCWNFYARRLQGNIALRCKRCIAWLRRRWKLSQTPALFDSNWYLHTYPDIAASGTDAFEHYLRWGAVEGGRRNPEFDTTWYL